MLDAQTQPLIDAVRALDLSAVNHLLDSGLDVNTMDEESGTLVSIVTDKLYDWWCVLLEAYESQVEMSDADKTTLLKPYMAMLELLIARGANLHLWDAEEHYGPLWDAASAACVPVVALLLAQHVDPNTRDDEGLSILSSISHLYYDCDWDAIDWTASLPEEKQTLELLRANGARTTAELEKTPTIH